MTAAPSSPATILADTRVILAGRTGLDAALRLDPALELVRVANLAEVVAEVASPLPDLPEGLTVVVSDALAREAGQGRVIRLCQQLRELNPRVRILGARTSDQPEAFKPESWGFDDAIASGAGPERPAGDVRSMMRAMKGQATHSEQPPPPPQAPAAVASPAPAITPALQPPPIPADASASPGDAALVAAMLRGSDITTAALALLRERLHDPDLAFITTSQPPANHTARVAWDEAVYGSLHSTRTRPEDLTAAARWLAGWLRLADQQAQLREAAFTDPLTGANNRRFFDLFASRVLGAAREKRHYVTILLFDIDNFKHYNDQFGHEAGDEILIEVARLMRAALRPTDRVCRLGGDEFAVIFHDPQGPRQEGSQHPADVRDIATRFQKQVSEHKFPKLANQAQGTLTISGGLATFPWDGNTPAELLAHADKLLLQSKKAGKNAITLGPGALR
jgi:two-component system, cell cycle response regulator